MFQDSLSATTEMFTCVKSTQSLICTLWYHVDHGHFTSTPPGGTHPYTFKLIPLVSLI